MRKEFYGQKSGRSAAWLLPPSKRCKEKDILKTKTRENCYGSMVKMAGNRGKV